MDLGCVKNRLENMFYWQVIIFKQTLILRKALNFKVSVHHQAALHRRNMIDTHSVLKVGLRRVEGYIGTYFWISFTWWELNNWYMTNLHEKYIWLDYMHKKLTIYCRRGCRPIYIVNFIERILLFFDFRRPKNCNWISSCFDIFTSILLRSCLVERIVILFLRVAFFTAGKRMNKARSPADTTVHQRCQKVFAWKHIIFKQMEHMICCTI